MPGYALSAAAAGDLASIADYTLRNFGIEQAMAYRDGLKRAFEYLAEFPHIARVRPELPHHSRVHRFQSHMIVYRIDDVGIFIQRVRHIREDWLGEE